MSIVQLALATAFSADWVLARERRTGPGTHVGDALRRFWASPELAAVGAPLDLPGDEWSAIIDRLEMLANERQPPSSGALWHEVARRTEALRATEPVAAVVASMYAAAAWEGAAGDQLYSQPWFAPLRGWEIFPLALSRALLAAGAIWSARLTARTAREFIEATHEAFFDEQKRSAIAAYHAVELEIEVAYGDAVRELAAALSESCRSDRPNFRPEVAAMLWTVGQVPEANLLSPGGRADYVPSLRTCERLVEQSMRRMPTDSFLQYIWLELKDRPPFNIRDHVALFGRVNNFYSELPVHQFDRLLGSEGPSRSYARNLSVHFGGAPAAEPLAHPADVFAMYGDTIGSSDPASYVRLIGLLNLSHPDADARAANWHRLASTAASILEEAERMALHKPFDNVLDIPFYYLEGDTAPAVERTLGALERYRAAGLWYWLTVITPTLGSAGDAASELRAEEERVLAELRGARFIRLIPHLPRHYQRYGYSLNERFAKPQAAADPYENPLDQTVARRQLAELQRELRALHEQLATEDPAYGAVRLDPCATLTAFAAALQP